MMALAHVWLACTLLRFPTAPAYQVSLYDSAAECERDVALYAALPVYYPENSKLVKGGPPPFTVFTAPLTVWAGKPPQKDQLAPPEREWRMVRDRYQACQCRVAP
jgi:hypothetical protein